jgi:hypothetical protein
MVRDPSDSSEITMSLTRLQLIVVPSWFLAVVALFIVRSTTGVPFTLASGLAALLLAIVPTAIFMVVFRGAPESIGQVLYTAEQTNPATASPVSRATITHGIE